MSENPMMTPMPGRLTSATLVAALRRRVESAGGFATILAKGDPDSGTIVLHCTQNGDDFGFFERISDFNGGYRLESCGPKPSADAKVMDEYVTRRRDRDPDLWLVELDVADAERFAAETIC